MTDVRRGMNPYTGESGLGEVKLKRRSADEVSAYFVAEIAKRDAEIERLSGEIADWESHWNSHETELKTEIERLRKVVDAVRDALSIETQRTVVEALRELEEDDDERVLGKAETCPETNLP